MSNETNILLPTASVDIFLQDKKTIEAANALKDDWRFSRVDVKVCTGDVERAIENYKEKKSPSLIIIETATIDSSFTQKLALLSENCEEGTSAIIIGPVNDVNLYRDLTSMGVSDYLVSPVPFETLSNIIAGNLIEKLGVKGSRLIAVTGAKGGVGTSALAQALAQGVSKKLKQKTFLMDAAGGWSSLNVGVGFDPATTLHEAVGAARDKDEDTLGRMFYKDNENLSVLAVGNDPMLEAPVLAQEYETLLDFMMVKYPVVIVDLSGAEPALKRLVVERAHELMVITTPTLSSLRSARSLMQEVKLLKDGEASSTDLVVNMAGISSSKEISKKDIQDSLGCKLRAVIPFDETLFLTCENEGKQLFNQKSGAEIIDKLLPIACDVLGQKLEQSKGGKSISTDFLSTIKDIFKKK